MSETKHTFLAHVANYLKGNPNQWVSAYVLMEIGGKMAWRTRLSECRTILGMTIENRQRKVGAQTVSEYCYRPAVGQQALPLGNQGGVAA